ncbi:MAG TPA: hypothetical protein VN493_19205 [Thermoanaerobaculia bacterium]|nr:hypothetical protein [Thermoanaerobaculia bacterium]
MSEQKAELWRDSFSSLPMFDVPAYACRSLQRLSSAERNRFLKAWHLLGRGGILALAREGDMALAGPGVCEALLARSWASRHRDPGEMLRLALAARDVAAELKTREFGRKTVAALQARSWGELANAYRVAGRAAEAARAFHEAFGRLELNIDSHLATHLLELNATFHGWSGDPGRAVAGLAFVAEVYETLGETHLAGRARITQSIFLSRCGRKDEALRLSSQGLLEIDRERDPLLTLTAFHNRLLLLLELGQRDALRQELALNRAAYSGTGAGAGEGLNVLALRLRWMEGRVLHDLGELEAAEMVLRQARDGLTALGLPHFSAVASLDLVATLLRQGRSEEAEVEALAAEAMFLSLEGRHDFLGVLLVLETAFGSGLATAELVEQALALLRQKELERGQRLLR